MTKHQTDRPHHKLAYSAAWIRRIQELARQKYSTEKIAQFLNKEDHETKRAGKWSRTAVWRILQRPQKKPVTKLSCNEPTEKPDSAMVPVVASKGPRCRTLHHSSTENSKPPNPEIPKPLQINDFRKWLPYFDAKQYSYGPIQQIFERDAGLEGPILHWDESTFSRVNGARGRERILVPEEANGIKSRHRRYQPPRSPPIQGLLQRALKLKEQMDSTPGLTRFALAKDLCLDPSRITQILNLLNLAPEIQTYIRDLPPTKHHDPIGDNSWMHLARINDRTLQFQEFERLRNRSKATSLVSSALAP